LKFEEDINSVPIKKLEIKEEKKQNIPENIPVGGLKSLLSGGNTSQKNNDTKVNLKNFFNQKLNFSQRQDLKLQ
jgi:hypothetical protein